MAIEGPNPLISTQKSSDSGLQVALHPLVLLTIYETHAPPAEGPRRWRIVGPAKW